MNLPAFNPDPAASLPLLHGGSEAVRFAPGSKSLTEAHPMNLSGMNAGNRAFTLLELLAVLAIVGLLMALALPILGRLLQSSQNSKSASNLRTLGAAMILYAAENNGAFPPSASQVTRAEGGWAPGGVGSWDQYILPYLFPNLRSNPGNYLMYYDEIRGSEALFSHPNDRGIVTGEKMLKRGYAMIAGAGKIGRATWEGTVFNPSERLVNISAPSKTLLLVENPGMQDNRVGRTGGAHVQNAVELTTRQPDLNGKEGHFHFLFADGHVQLLDLQETVGTGTLQQSRGMWTINPND
jgi:prepilin-type N-terminal cleavage/methylation domain-containing protein/prepilin-type processing-associated H-X9-DG protein